IFDLGRVPRLVSGAASVRAADRAPVRLGASGRVGSFVLDCDDLGDQSGLDFLSSEFCRASARDVRPDRFAKLWFVSLERQFVSAYWLSRVGLRHGGQHWENAR